MSSTYVKVLKSWRVTIILIIRKRVSWQACHHLIFCQQLNTYISIRRSGRISLSGGLSGGGYGGDISIPNLSTRHFAACLPACLPGGRLETDLGRPCRVPCSVNLPDVCLLRKRGIGSIGVRGCGSGVAAALNGAELSRRHHLRQYKWRRRRASAAIMGCVEAWVAVAWGRGNGNG